MTTSISALYEGKVMHHRLRPRRHRLAYRVFWLLLDFDEIDALSRKILFFSRNRFNIFSFHDADYGVDSTEPLRAQVERQMSAAGIDCIGGSIRLLTMPRILGYAFNPLSVYFCHNRSGTLAAILYEVNNTFGERHSYLIPVSDGGAGAIRQQCPKQFYVSPFMDMAMDYVFHVVPPRERVVVSISGSDADGPLITAALSARRTELCDAALARAFVLYPLLTLKVVAGIHWEALLMWIKGLRLRKRPSPPAHPVTIAHPCAPSSDS